jgi:hypothetical protein
MFSWLQRPVVLDVVYISFDPVLVQSMPKSMAFSAPVRDVSQGEPIYVALSGRPSGVLNVLLKLAGIGRRFEFLMSKTQVVTRIGSTSLQVMSISKLEGLNTITVALVRSLRAAIAWLLLFLGFLGVRSALAVGWLTQSDPSPGDRYLWMAALSVSAVAAAYNFFVGRSYHISFDEAGEEVASFVVSPSLFEGTSLSLQQLTQIAQIFRVLKQE